MLRLLYDRGKVGRPIETHEYSLPHGSPMHKAMDGTKKEVQIHRRTLELWSRMEVSAKNNAKFA